MEPDSRSSASSQPLSSLSSVSSDQIKQGQVDEVKNDSQIKVSFSVKQHKKKPVIISNLFAGQKNDNNKDGPFSIEAYEAQNVLVVEGGRIICNVSGTQNQQLVHKQVRNGSGDGTSYGSQFVIPVKKTTSPAVRAATQNQRTIVQLEKCVADGTAIAEDRARLALLRQALPPMDDGEQKLEGTNGSTQKLTQSALTKMHISEDSKDDVDDSALSPDYGAIPIEHFGLAFLRGCGWTKTDGIGQTNRRAVPLHIFDQQRPKGLGLGATLPTLVQKTSDKSSDSGDAKKSGAGSAARIENGKYRTKSVLKRYGFQQTFDSDTNLPRAKIAGDGQQIDGNTENQAEGMANDLEGQMKSEDGMETRHENWWLISSDGTDFLGQSAKPSANGTLIKCIGGLYRGMYGRMAGLDVENNSVIIELYTLVPSPGGSSDQHFLSSGDHRLIVGGVRQQLGWKQPPARINQFFVRPVPESEFDQYRKRLEARSVAAIESGTGSPSGIVSLSSRYETGTRDPDRRSQTTAGNFENTNGYRRGGRIRNNQEDDYGDGQSNGHWYQHQCRRARNHYRDHQDTGDLNDTSPSLEDRHYSRYRRTYPSRKRRTSRCRSRSADQRRDRFQ